MLANTPLSLFSGPGRTYAKPSGNQSKSPTRPSYAVVDKGNMRSQRLGSLSKQAHHHPSMPKGGAKKMARQASQGEIMQEQFMQTPDAGLSG